MLIVQPISNFGDQICSELVAQDAGHQRWQTFEFAVAWINYAGAQKVKQSALDFLARGGRIHAMVGLDFGSTTYEGLAILLDLEDAQAGITTHVFCDENPACTFHPKIFLFSNEDRARLFVGSNNMTGAGLNTNVEISIALSATLNDETIQQARQTLASWRDERELRTRKLTRVFLEELRDHRYVLTEKELRDRRNSEARPATGNPLFGRSPTLPRAAPARTPIFAHKKVLLMRVRPRRNGKQIQISMKVHASFMRSTNMVISIDGSHHDIGYNSARGVRNTARFEAPEMMGMVNPVARFQWVSVGPKNGTTQVLRYELFDADSDTTGANILQRLRQGISAPPATNLDLLSTGETALSTSTQASAQWYRLDSV